MGWNVGGSSGAVTADRGNQNSQELPNGKAILNKQKCLFFKNREQEGKTVLVWGSVPVRGGKT
jgi:hypothetical protein